MMTRSRGLVPLVLAALLALAACSTPSEIELRDLPCVEGLDTIVENGVTHVHFRQCLPGSPSR